MRLNPDISKYEWKMIFNERQKHKRDIIGHNSMSENCTCHDNHACENADDDVKLIMCMLSCYEKVQGELGRFHSKQE